MARTFGSGQTGQEARLITPDDLAVTGRTLYGERWQTSLAHDLHVSDRTMRRWLGGEFPIPAGVEDDVREVLTARLREIGGLVSYTVNPADRSVFHYPTFAFFRYDDADRLTLLNGQMIAPDKIALVTRGGEEALRRERERDPRIKVMWVDQAGRPAGTEQLHGFLRGSVIVPPGVDLTDPVAEEAFDTEEGEIHR